MTDVELPPPGPARDRLVAEAVGWSHWDREFPWNPATQQYLAPSTSDPDALAALKAWCKSGRRYRSCRIEFDESGVMVDLFENEEDWYDEGPTLHDAASAALARWALDRRQG